MILKDKIKKERKFRLLSHIAQQGRHAVVKLGIYSKMSSLPQLTVSI